MEGTSRPELAALRRLATECPMGEESINKESTISYGNCKEDDQEDHLREGSCQAVSSGTILISSQFPRLWRMLDSLSVPMPGSWPWM